MGYVLLRVHNILDRMSTHGKEDAPLAKAPQPEEDDGEEEAADAKALKQSTQMRSAMELTAKLTGPPRAGHHIKDA